MEMDICAHKANDDDLLFGLDLNAKDGTIRETDEYRKYAVVADDDTPFTMYRDEDGGRWKFELQRWSASELVKRWRSGWRGTESGDGSDPALWRKSLTITFEDDR